MGEQIVNWNLVPVYPSDVLDQKSCTVCRELILGGKAWFWFTGRTI